MKLIKTNPSIGWVRGDTVSDTATYKELADLRKQLDEFRSRGKSASLDGVDRENLARDDDLLPLQCTIEFKDEETLLATMYEWTPKVTVDELFGATAPTLMLPTSDNDLKEKISEFLRNHEWVDIENDELYKSHKYEDFYIEDESFDTIKIQFLALGFIEKRKVGSSLMYGLTEAGEKKMYKLRAIKRPSG